MVKSSFQLSVLKESFLVANQGAVMNQPKEKKTKSGMAKAISL